MSLATAVCFYNNGTLDKRAFTMMGLSAKADDTAIGFFGTGFKYAIATLLRNNCTIRVVVRNDEHDDNDERVFDFHSAVGNFRGKEHDFVYCVYTDSYSDEEETIELPFTTHLGANWKLWQAYRELFTNAKDEAGGVQLVNLPRDGGSSLRPGDVNIYVTGADFLEVYHNHDKYFLNAQAVATGYRMRCVPKMADHDNVVYYKTMYTGTKLDKPTYFTYDYIKTVELTEDRTLADTWFLRNHIGEIWLANMSFDMLVEHLPKIAKDTYYEYGIESGYHDGCEDFHRACAYLNEMNRPMPMWARDVYSKKLPFDQQVEQYKPTRHQRTQLKKALDILAHHKHNIDGDKLILCASLPNDVLGYYKAGIIYIAKSAFERGFEKLLGTLYEEYLHHIEGCDDMSRQMQNILVDKCASLMEQVYEMEQSE
jgi:hypothetical protein